MGLKRLAISDHCIMVFEVCKTHFICKRPLTCLLLIVLYSAALVCFWAMMPAVRRILPQTPTTLRTHVPIKKENVGLQNLSSCFKPNTSSSWNSYADKTCLQNIGLKNSFPCQHFMILSPVPGRTGNQLFAAAALLATATRHGYTAILNSSYPLAEWFNLPNLSNLPLCYNSVNLFLVKLCCTFDKRVTTLNHSTHWKLYGTFQSWRFFEGAEDIVRNAFKIKGPFSTAARKFIDDTIPTGAQTICIHVRRGDFVQLSERTGLTVAPVRYIKDAMTYFKNRYTNVHFFVISDDTKWCKNNLRWDNITISPFGTVGHDMALMIESDHVIVTSGSFGWWGAWLSGGGVVYWKGFPRKGSQISFVFNMTDYYPPHWVGLWG